jgi:hypothetical protein
MTIAQILDYALPYSAEELRCGIKKAQKGKARIKLAAMIEAYKRGDIVNWNALSLSVDIEEIVKAKLN